MTEPIDIKKLDISFENTNGLVRAVKEVAIKIYPNKVTTIIGESGSGKSVLAMGILGLLPKYTKIDEEIYIGNRTIKSLRKTNGFYGSYFGLIPQSPGQVLSPSLKIIRQFEDTVKKPTYRDLALKILKDFDFKDPERVLSSYPYQLSGGMAQRVVSAISLSSQPKWLIADEPTKGLDKETLRATYDLYLKIKENFSSMLIITHDIDFARIISDEIIVMYDGQVIEQGQGLLEEPYHPYTQGFLLSLPENGFQPMEGIAPGPYDQIKGCSFYNRCPQRLDICKNKVPELYTSKGRKVKCFLYA